MTSKPDPKLVAYLADLIAEQVRGGRSPDEAARKHSAIHPPNTVQQAKEKYLSETKRIWTMREPRGVVDPYLEPWYLGPAEDDKLWPAYRKLLASKGWHPNAIGDLDQASTSIVSMLRPPGALSIRTRGLVVGHVQSGKTSNFTAVIAKAADVGYRFFIVLSGLNNTLRKQTQRRLEEDLLRPHAEDWMVVTGVDSDFSESRNVNALLTGKASARVLGVVKKNKSRLKRLLQWLEGARPEVLRDCPVLVIDDEADEASPNSHPNPLERSQINKLIVRLLVTLPKAAYVGYTATPFANVFIDPTLEENLYPSDFIVALPRGEDYFGAEQLFGRQGLDSDDEPVEGPNVIRVVDKAETPRLQPANRNQRASFVFQITPSLREALLYFWLVTAARHERGQRGKHSSMLVHTTQYSIVHANARPVVERLRDEIKAALKSNDTALRGELETLWNREQRAVPSAEYEQKPVPFSAVWPHLTDVLDRTEVKVENSISFDRIDYEIDEGAAGKIYVVLGGNVLSRGVTLEGLSVSLFVRSASAYDTLLQMGRWFGYRPGYEDLPRVWMTEELRDYFFDLATVEHEIRLDIARYETDGLSPSDFAVRVRTHPHLAITSKLKMAAAEVAQMSFGGSEVQTIVFRDTDAEWLRTNWNATLALIKSLRDDLHMKAAQVGGRPHHLFFNVPVEYVLSFLDAYQIDENNHGMRSDLIRGYIEDQNRRGKIRNWTVAIATRRKPLADLGTIDVGLDAEVPLISRARLLRNRGAGRVDIKALMSEIDHAIDVPMTTEQLLAVKAGKKRKELRSLRDEKVPDRGLLLLYPVARNSRPLSPTRTEMRAPLDAAEHVMGIALAFPAAHDTTAQSYMTVDLSDLHKELPDVDEDFPQED